MDIPKGNEIEKQVASALLGDASLYYSVSKELNEDCFSDPKYLAIYQSVQQLYDRNKTYDIVSILDYFEQTNKWEVVGDRNEIISLFTQNTLRSNSFTEHIKILRNYSYKRALLNAASEITELALDPSKDIDAIAEAARQSVEDCSGFKSNTTTELVSSLVDDISAYIEKGDSKGISTGLILLNRLLGGFKPAKLYILAARTGMGKTNLAVFFALKMSQMSKFPVVFFSAEMAVEAISIRFISNLCQINSHVIGNNYMSYEEQDKFKLGLEKFSKLNLVIDQTSASELNADRIASVVRSVVAKFGGVSAVFIDYIQLLGDYKISRRDLAIGEISRACKDFGKIFNTPFICLAQVKRDVETRADKRPSLSDLKDSGSLEQDADAILTLYRDEYYNEFSDTPGITELAVVKHRDGPTGLIKLEHELSTCTYNEPKTFALGLRS